MVGNQGGGKTSLLRRFVKGELQNPQTKIETLGYDDSYEMKVKIDGELFNLKFGDTAGQERFSKMTSSYFRMHDAVIVVFDMTDANSLEGAMRWIKQIQEVKEMPMILVGNKSELEEYRILSDQLFEEIHEST